MHKFLLATLFLVVFLSLNGSAQIGASVAKGIQFEEPAGWYNASKNERTANIKRFDFTEDQLESLLKDDKKSSVVAVFYRTDPTIAVGIIPTIQVVIRPKKTALNFDGFKTAIVNSISKMPLEELVQTGDAVSLEISGVRSVLVNTTFKLRGNEQVFSIRSRTYAIPRGNHFFQISMSDENDEGWTEKEFTQFINSVKFTN